MKKRRINPTKLILIFIGLSAVMLPLSLVDAQTSCCVGRVGDANGDGRDEPTIGDVSVMINVSFIYGYVYCEDFFPCVAEADINQSGGFNPACTDVTIGDISILIDYLFITGPSVGLPYCLGQTGDPYGYLHNMSACKVSFSGTSSNSTCVQYEYDGQGTLLLTHINAGLNCCPQPTLTVNVLADTIFVTEVDSGLCHCLCLYDIEYRVVNLPPGHYRIKVEEAIAGGGEPLDFWVDFAQSPSGTVCEARSQYPWGSEPVGTVTGMSGCKSHGVGAATDPAPADQSCIDLQYDGAGTLTFTHVNAGFNCCPQLISAQFNFDGSTITVTEYEQFGPWGGCLCDCLFDIQFQITLLPPGEYHLVFVEPYRDPTEPALDFTVDLTQATNSETCVTRLIYPWGLPPTEGVGDR